MSSNCILAYKCINFGLIRRKSLPIRSLAGKLVPSLWPLCGPNQPGLLILLLNSVKEIRSQQIQSLRQSPDSGSKECCGNVSRKSKESKSKGPLSSFSCCYLAIVTDIKIMSIYRHCVAGAVLQTPLLLY